MIAEKKIIFNLLGRGRPFPRMILHRLENLCHQSLAPLSSPSANPVTGSMGFRPVQARARCPGYQSFCGLERNVGEGR
jgi:hypothetical protein